MFLLSLAHYIPAPEAVQWSSHQYILLLRPAEKARPVRNKVQTRVNSVSWLRERTRPRAQNVNKYQLYGAITTISRDLRLPQQWLWGCRFLGYEGMKPDRNPPMFRCSLHLQYFHRNMSEFLSYYKKSHAGRQQSSLIFPPEFQPTRRNKNIPRNYAKVSYGNFNHCSGANKYRNGFNSLDDHVSPPPRPDRL